MNDFKILLQAVLDSNSIGQSDINKIQKVIDKYHLNLTADLDKATILSEIKKIVPQLEAELKKMTGVDIQINDQALLKAFNQIEKQAESTAQKLNKIQHLSDTGHFARQVSDISVEYNKLSSVTDDLEKDFTRLNKLQEILKNPQVDDSNYREFNTLIEKLKNNMHVLANEQKQAGSYDLSSLADPKKITALSEDVLKFMQSNTKMSRQYKKDFSGIFDKLQQDSNLTKKEIIELEREIKKLKLSVRNADQMGFSFVDKMKNAFVKFSEWGFATGLVSDLWQGITRVFDASVKLSGSVTDLTIATDLNKNQIESLTESYSELGDEINATLTDVIESGTEWIKQGQSIADTETLITNAMILAKIAKLSSADATKYLTSAMKGYQVSVEGTLGVVDKLSAVDMASATDVGGLAEGMSQVASSADLAGVSMDKLLGYLATIGEVTQSGMSEVGTTLNAVFSRMGNIKLSRLKDYETGEDLSNVETVLRGVGLSLRDSNDSFREFDEVLDETASKWDSYSETQQRAIASAFAGTHHLNEFIVLMENYDNALKYTEISAESSGEAMQKFSEYQDSVAAHTDLFEKAIEDLANTAIDSGLVNWFIDLGTTGVKALDWIIDKIGVLTPLLGGVGIGAFVKNFAWLVKGDNNFKLSYSF